MTAKLKVHADIPDNNGEFLFAWVDKDDVAAAFPFLALNWRGDKMYTVNNRIREWLTESKVDLIDIVNVSPYSNRKILLFRVEGDAMLFKLRWL